MFGAKMEVNIVNDGPVTINIDSDSQVMCLIRVLTQLALTVVYTLLSVNQECKQNVFL